MSKLKKIKNFVNEHRTEIEIGCLAVVSIGLGITAYRTVTSIPKVTCSREEAEKAYEFLEFVTKVWDKASEGADGCVPLIGDELLKVTNTPIRLTNPDGTAMNVTGAIFFGEMA